MCFFKEGKMTYLKRIISISIFSGMEAWVAMAQVVWSGDVSPGNPLNWTSFTSGTIGDLSNGTLTVTDGGAVYNGTGYIGYDAGSSGAVTVDGSGSVVSNSSSLLVGYFGSGALNVYHGGAVYNGFGYIAGGDNSTGSAVIEDSGSVWSNASFLSVGFAGSGALRVSDGGAVYNAGGTVGYRLGSTGAAAVSDSNSVWSSSGALFVGYAGTGSLDIFDGGEVLNTDGTIGYRPGSTGDVSVAGGGSVWTNSGRLFVGNSGTGNLTVSGGGSVYNTSGFIANATGSTGSVSVIDSGSVWSNSSTLLVGTEGSGTLLISNGGSVYNTSGYIGYGSRSTGSVTVAGSGSIWSNTSSLHIGESGVGTLIVTNGGTVKAAEIYMGRQKTNRKGSIYLARDGLLDADTLYFSPQDVYGSGTAMVRGVVSDLNVVFDGASQTTSRAGDVTVLIDAGSGDGALGAGWIGTGSLQIKKGAVVKSSAGVLGYHFDSAGAAMIDGAGSVWSNKGSFFAGYSGDGRLSITGGGTLYDQDGFIGANVGSFGNVAVVDLGSIWSNTGSLTVGASGDGVLTISDGGAVYNTSGSIGFGPGLKGLVTVKGGGSTWFNSESLSVGEYGAGGLVIADGGAVYNVNGYIGRVSGSTGLVLATGVGSVWSNFGFLTVGGYGEGSMTVENGAKGVVGGSMHLASGSSIILASGGRLDVADDAVLASDSLLGFVLSDLNGTGVMTVGRNLYNDGAILKLTSSDHLKMGSEYELVRAASISDSFSSFETNNLLSVYDVELKQSVTNVTATVQGVKNQNTDTPSVSKATAAATRVAMSDISNRAGAARALLRSRQLSGSRPVGTVRPAGALVNGEWTAYMRQFNALGGLDSDGSQAGFDWQTSGYMIGMEKWVNEQLVIGFSGGQSSTDLDGLRGAGGGASKMFMASLYGNWFTDCSYCELGLFYARADSDTERIDTALERYTGTYDSTLFGGWIEAGWLVKKTETTELEPYIRSTYVSGTHDGYTDAGGEFPMKVSANGTDNWELESGARLSREWKMENEMPLRMELKAGVQCELLDNRVKVNTLVAGTSQRASSPDADRAALVFGARVDLGLTDSLNIGAGYEPTFAGNWQNHTFDLRLTIEF